jgi:hypothetical protein
MTLSVLLGLIFFAVVGVVFVWAGLNDDYDLMCYQNHISYWSNTTKCHDMPINININCNISIEEKMKYDN